MELQSYSKIDYLKFKETLKIKDEPWNIENIYIKKANNYIKYLKNIPWIKMVAVWNSVAMNHATKESDIDLYIVTSKNRMWFVRILATFIFSILWLRKTKNNHAWKFCLSFFSTIEWMDFSRFVLINDIYLYFWIIYLKPILNYDNTYENFIKANNSWADFSEYEDIIENNKSYVKYEWFSFWNRFKIFNFINSSLKFLFEKRAIKKSKKLWKPYWIVITPDLLKFHNDDKRAEIRDKIFTNEQ